LKSELKVLNAELNSLQIAEKPSKKTIENKIDEIGRLRTKLMKMQAGHQIKVRSLLTDEQRVIFDQRKMHRGKRGGNRILSHRGARHPRIRGRSARMMNVKRERRPRIMMFEGRDFSDEDKLEWIEKDEAPK
jgi:hypothetical protein